MKKLVLAVAVLAVAGSVYAQVNVGDGLSGLWRFQNSTDKLKATVGTDLTTSSAVNSTWYVGPTWINIGTPAAPWLYGDNGIVQEVSWDYLTVTHGIAPNGGGSYVNEYTVAVDYQQGNLAGLWEGNYYNSLFQTATGNGNDGDLFIKGPDRANSVIGNGDTGYSTLTFDSEQWHRIVWSVDNGNFFRVYVDGALFLDAAGQGVDGRFSLDPTLLLFADNDWEDAWGMVATAMVWDHALTGAEIAGMGSTTTALLVPEPGMLSLLALGGLVLFRRIRR